MNLNYDSKCRNNSVNNTSTTKINCVENCQKTSQKCGKSKTTKFNSRTSTTGSPGLSSVSTAEGSDLKVQKKSASKQVKAKKSQSLKKLKKAIIITLTQASFDFDEYDEVASSQSTSENYLNYFNHMKSKFKRLFVQDFHSKEILMFSMELFRKVLNHAEKTDTQFSMKNDSLFKIYMVCFFIGNKFVDEMHYISAEDLAYIAHTSEKVIKSLEIALLSDVLGWNILNLRQCDKQGNYMFLRWDYNHVVKSFKSAFPDY